MSKFKDNLETFYKPIPMPGGYKFDTVKTLKTTLCYMDEKFTSGETDSMGVKKNFFGRVKSSVLVSSKFVDIDTSNIIFLPVNNDDTATWLYEKEFKLWTKETGFAKLINEIKDHYPRGHAVVKPAGDKWERVPIANLRFKPSAKSLDKSPFVYEYMTMHRDEIEEMSWNGEGLEELLAHEQDEFTIYVCYDKEKGKWNRTIKGGTDIEEKYLNGDDEPAFVLHEDETDKLPYRELRWEAVDGRLLGRGVPEDLIPEQQRLNEVKHLEKLTLYIKALALYLTNDDEVASNVMSLNVGQIIKTNGQITPVSKDNSDLSAFASEKNDWQANATRKSFDTDIARGDTLPSNTPLGLGQLQMEMTASYFDGKREDFGLFLKDWIYEDIIPSFAKDNRKAHKLMIAYNDPDIAKVIELVATNRAAKAIEDGTIPAGDFKNRKEEEKEKLKQRLNINKALSIDIPDNFYKDVKFKMDIVITGESMNIMREFSGMEKAFATIAANPQILQDENLRGIFMRMMNIMGVSSSEIGTMEANIKLNEGQAMPAQATAQPQPEMAQQL